MSSEYRLDICTAAGVKIAEVTDYLSLAYSKRVNAPGLLTFTLPGNHAVIPQLEHNSQVLVYRRNTALGLPWTVDFVGLWRGQRRRYTDHDLFVATCPGVLTMLAWRIVAWKAGIANRSRFDDMPAETVMKTLVEYNAGANATTANGRIRDGVIEGITVAADGGFGNVISKGCAYENLLEALQKIAAIGGGDFDLVKVGAASWQFRWYTGQRGTDRTDSVLFALERGNMAAPEYTHDRVDERTVCIVAGQGEESDRAVEVRAGPDYALDNDIETFVEASDLTTTAGLQSRGDTELEEARARQQFGFGVLQTPGCFYGVHYTLGDLVKARYGPVSLTQWRATERCQLERLHRLDRLDADCHAIGQCERVGSGGQVRHYRESLSHLRQVDRDRFGHREQCYTSGQHPSCSDASEYKNAVRNSDDLRCQRASQLRW